MQEIRVARSEWTSAHTLFAAFMISCAIASLLIGSFPLAASIATIFLFAGVHNWMEFRYFVARMPLRWGRSRSFYIVAIAGVIVLTVTYLSLYFANGTWLWSPDAWTVGSAAWDSAFVIWLAVLLVMRGRHRPRSDWSWAFPVAFALAALAWAAPQYWSLSLVYIHPLVALWFLERQIRRTRPEWLTAYHCCLATIPIFVLGLWIALYRTPDVSEDTGLFWRIVQHAGSQLLPGVSTRLLVATHVFLESIHYSVWILLLPLVDKKAVPWRLDRIPLFAAKQGLPRLLAAAFIVGAVVTVALWGGFAVDYARTRDIYFAFAIGHVLAEFPFLIKLL